jgi:TIR domain
MDRIKAFISYSSEEKKIGGRLKQYLISYCGYEPFIAHDDIAGSEEWEKEILHAIRAADFFIPLVSKHFKTSVYTDQETGFAVGVGRKIIPIKLDSTDPYGFISKYQALPYKINPPPQTWQRLYRPDNLFQLAIAIAHIGFHHKPHTHYYKKSLNSLVYALCHSGSFETANAIITILSECNHQLTKEHIQEITGAMKINSQIIGAWGLPKLKEILEITYGCHID